MAKTIFKPVSYELSQLLGDIDLGKLALPELQRPFIWQKTAVRVLRSPPTSIVHDKLMSPASLMLRRTMQTPTAPPARR